MSLYRQLLAGLAGGGGWRWWSAGWLAGNAPIRRMAEGACAIAFLIQINRFIRKWWWGAGVDGWSAGWLARWLTSLLASWVAR